VNTRKILLIAASVLLSACGTTRTTIDLTSEHWRPPISRIKIEAVEIRLPTSTIAIGIVTENEKVMGVVGGTARPLIDIPLSLLGAGSTVGGAAVLGREIKSGLKGIEAITPTE